MTLAFVMSNSQSVLSSLSMYLLVLTAVPIMLLFAPQEVRRDKRARIGVLALVMVGISAPAYAVPLYYCNGPLWYLMVECWFI